MLQDHRCHTTLPALDLPRAQKFYEETLGLSSSKDINHPGAVMFEHNGTRFLLFPTSNAERGGHTQMGFMVDDIETEVAELRSRGVVFEDYDLPGLKTENGIATVDSARAAWFKDSEGNLLDIVQISE